MAAEFLIITDLVVKRRVDVRRAFIPKEANV